MFKWWWKIQLAGAEMALDEFEMYNKGNTSVEIKTLRKDLQSAVNYYKEKITR